MKLKKLAKNSYQVILHSSEERDVARYFHFDDEIGQVLLKQRAFYIYRAIEGKLKIIKQIEKDKQREKTFRRKPFSGI